ncbi:hypothetical protein RvY_11365 [Ramazzottius varieornatus]|uniref:Uncharacterized protein n=1 Tax=Ramazzottius varieornatus TaxID=947166 RepID=A0A1D1VFY3_RAMVA|nr:hypothetical protein RvY_11365 [Ramazzottius varieornatus]
MKKWRSGGLNPRPQPCEDRALPLSYIPIRTVRSKVYLTIRWRTACYFITHDRRYLRVVDKYHPKRVSCST